MPRPKKPSVKFKRDPTGSQRKINIYERALTGLFQNYKRRVVADLERENTRALEAPSQKPLKVDLKGFSQYLDKVEQEELLKPSERMIEVRIPEAYKAGNAFGSIQLGAPIEVRKDEWKRIGALLEKNKNGFAKITAETGGRIRSTIADGIINEKPFGQIARDIVRNVDDVGIVRATAMARTEIMEAVNTGIHDRYQAAGVEKEEWLTALDDATCEDCEANDGKIIPDDIDERPPLHRRCRCTIIPVIEIPEMQ